MRHIIYNTVFSMERLKIEEIANNYGMHLENFAQRKVLADQINFALDFGMEYYQVRFHFRFCSRPTVDFVRPTL